MFKEVFVVFVVTSSCFMAFFSRFIWSLTSPFSNLNPTLQVDGIIYTVFFLSYTLAQLPSGVLSDKLGEKGRPPFTLPIVCFVNFSCRIK